MVLFNYSTKELTAKVVYYGPGLCGKTTNLQWIHEKVPIKNKGKMLSLATETDRTLFFDFLPIEIGTIRGMRTRIQLYTVPGQVFYNATRRMVLKGADCLVFVVDSQEPMLDASIESFENLRQNLEANEIDPDQIPMVLQYNKRDLPNALPIEILNERMNPNGHPFYEAVAVKGVGVEETLKGVTKLVFKSLSAKYGEPAAAAPSRTAPDPVSGHPPRPVSAPSATIPPGPHLVPQSPEELLDGLDLTPPALETEPEPRREAMGAAVPVQARSTLVAEEDEAEDLRRRIMRPMSEPDYEVNLEEISPPVEEVTLDSEPLPTFEPEGENEESEPTLATMSLDDAQDLPPSNFAPPNFAPTTLTPTTLTPPTLSHSARPSEPAPLVIEVEAGRTDVTVPIELEVEPGVDQVSLNLRLVFKVRR
jgi:signal recognition particle receptor subunit beta